MKTRHDGKVSLSKMPYTVVYPCCDVLCHGLETTACWSCGKEGGRSLYDIPLQHWDLIELFRSYRQTTSTLSIEFSMADKETMTWRHP